jgi:hypothetical protein
MSLKKAKKDNKLSPKYYGPYKVLHKIGTMAYKLEFPASSQVHPVFHVSCLKKVIGDKIPVQTIFPELDKKGKIILEPEAITKTRIFQLRNRSISEYLIKWRKLPAEDSTWEDNMALQFWYHEPPGHTCTLGMVRMWDCASNNSWPGYMEVSCGWIGQSPLMWHLISKITGFPTIGAQPEEYLENKACEK